MKMAKVFSLSLLHSEWPKLYGVLAILSAIGLSIGANSIGDEGKHKMAQLVPLKVYLFTLISESKQAGPTVHVLTEGRES